ncbi:protein translocase subunit SecF, partial [Candidatus Woesearchaeota archaeon]|nr:protein translocase subunit SecF [Candidatus Woesearchaeota archaeon]
SLLLVVLALIQISTQYALTGEFVHRGVSLKGGSIITLTALDNSNWNEATLRAMLLDKFPKAEISVRSLSSVGNVVGLAIDSGAQENTEIDAMLKVLKDEGVIHANNYSVEVIGSSLGESFFRQVITALIFAFVLMGIVVFIYFRVPIPSAAVILAGFSDIVITMAIFNLTGEKLNSAGIAAFLMLIGYSIDTDILLTSRVLKRKEGSVMDRIYGAIVTGLTMTGTTVSAVLLALIFIQNETIKQIMLIIFIGLVVDVIMTWIQNVGLLRWYLEKHHLDGSKKVSEHK